MSYKRTLGWLSILLFASTCFAQTADAPKPPPKIYKIDVVVKELDGAKVLNARTYSLSSSVDLNGSIRNSSKVPVNVSSVPSSASWQMYDIGVNIDCRGLRETDTEFLATLTVTASNVADGKADSNYPVVRTNSWSAPIFLPLRKPVIVFASDDTNSTHKMVVEVTATILH